MKTSIKTEFTHCYFNCDTFKQKETTILLNSISGSRLNNDMKLSGYGMISFDEENDKPHRYPEIKFANDDGTPIQWNRKGINCIVFDLICTDKNHVYDKLFLYHTNSKNGQGVWYGWIAYNMKTREKTHRFFVDHDTQDLLVSLNRFLYHINTVKRNKIHLDESRKNSIKLIA